LLDELKLPKGVTVRDERAEAAPVELHGGGMVAGRVYDIRTGHTITGAKLAAFKPVSGEKTLEWQNVGEGASNDDGDFHLLVSDPAAYDLRVSAEGYAPRTVHLERKS